MPNRRGTDITSEQLETAHPWPEGRWTEAEPQDRRGQVGHRGIGDTAQPRETHSPDEWTGVRPLPPLLPSMPIMKPGDQGG